MSDLSELDAVGHADLVRSGQATAREVTDAAIARVERVNDALNAVIHERFDRARAEADALDSDGTADKPLAGVPFVLKDMDGFLADEPQHLGSEHMKRAGWKPDHTSEIFQRLIDAGAIILGKTNCPELGLVITTEPEAYGPTRNPWNTGHSTGGSSGGSAAAVASGMVPVAHGGDGGGSIRIPASECGLVGLKPTRARNSMGPSASEQWNGLVHWGVMSRTVRDTAALLDVTSGPQVGDPYSAAPPARPYREEVGADPGRLKVGLRTTVPTSGAEVHPECKEAVEHAGRLLDAAGHDVDFASPKAFEEDLMGLDFLTAFGAWVARELDEFEEWTGTAPTQDSVEPATWAIAEIGRSITATQYLAALDGFNRYSRAVGSWWNDYDILVMPVLPTPPPELGYFKAEADNPLAGATRAGEMTPFCMPFNITGQPSMSLPLHWTDDGLPVGVQFTSAYGRDDILIRVASQLEAAAPWADRRPAVWA